MNKILILIIVTILFISSVSKSQSTSKDFSTIAGYMQGSFSSEPQSVRDTDYYNISLHITPIWKERIDGLWFYVEQAMMDMKDKPYRQRVYHLTQSGDTTFESAVYTLTDPLRFAGKINLVEQLTSDSLILKKGCSVILRKDKAGNFEGGTEGGNCASDLRGASYATSDVTVTATMLRSWDRGFNADGKQVWGAEKGPYEFVKIR